MKKQPINKILQAEQVQQPKLLTHVKMTLYMLIIAFSLYSCSKDNGGKSNTSGDYYFRTSLEGRKVEFHTANFQGGGDDGRFEHLVVGGYESSYRTSGGPIPPSLDFEIWRLGGNTTKGTYSTPAEQKMIARYAVQKPDGTLLYNTSFANDVFTLKIEAISITEGSFNLPYETIVNP